MPKVSVIIPIYNAKAYIETCLDSLLAQTLRDIEIIAIDDGSTDGTGPMLDAYSARDSRVKTIHCQNGGVSRARNIGMQAATGEYIGFVDADDWVDEEMFEGMYRTAIRHRLDVCICDFYWEYANRKPVPANLDLPVDTIMPRNFVEEKLIKGTMYIATFGAVWKSLIRREILVRESILFSEQLDIMEDGMFNMHLYFHTDRIMYIRRHYYHYRQVKSGNLSMKYRANLFELMQIVTNTVMTFFRDHNMEFSEFQHPYELGVCFMAAYCMMNICNRYNTASAQDKILDIRSLLDNEELRAAIERINENHSFQQAYKAAKPMQRATYNFVKTLVQKRRVLSIYLVFTAVGRYYTLLL